MKYNFKLIIAFFIFFYLIVSSVFYYLYHYLSLQDIKHESEANLKTILAVRNFISNVQRPLLSEVNKALIDERLLSATFVTDEILQRRLKISQRNFNYRIISDNPTNKAHRANKDEIEILKKFRHNKNITIYTKIIEKEGEKYLFSAMPVERNTNSCLKCHGDPKKANFIRENYGEMGFGERLGDIKGMIALEVPLKGMLDLYKKEFIVGGSIMFIVFVIILALLYTIAQKDTSISSYKEELVFRQNRLAIMGRMMSFIAHQWKQPLTHISYIFINLQVLSFNNKLSTQKLSQKVDEANKQINFMNQTMQDFRSFFSSKELEIAFMSDILSKTKALIIDNLKEEGIGFSIKVKEDFQISSKINELLQVFLNIIQNAIEAFLNSSQKERMISINIDKTKDTGLVTIYNNASFIDENIIANLFSAHFSTKSKENSGIGLYICKMILEKYDAKISCENVDEGVKFHIEFALKNTPNETK